MQEPVRLYVMKVDPAIHFGLVWFLTRSRFPARPFEQSLYRTKVGSLGKSVIRARYGGMVLGTWGKITDKKYG